MADRYEHDVQRTPGGVYLCVHCGMGPRSPEVECYARLRAALDKLTAFIADDERTQALWVAVDSITPEQRETSAKKWVERTERLRADAALGEALREAREAWGPTLYACPAFNSHSVQPWECWYHDDDGWARTDGGPTELEALQAATAAARAKGNGP